jgi:hypothetical protein
VYKPKRVGRRVELVTVEDQVSEKGGRVIDYFEEWRLTVLIKIPIQRNSMIQRTVDKSDFPVGMCEEIERVLDQCKQLPDGLSVYRPVIDSPLMFPLQRPAEMELMFSAARTVNPKVVMEIGADKSGGLYHWCRSVGSVEVVDRV